MKKAFEHTVLVVELGRLHSAEMYLIQEHFCLFTSAWLLHRQGPMKEGKKRRKKHSCPQLAHAMFL